MRIGRGFPVAVLVAAACSRDGGGLQAIRQSLNPPAPPVDTIPEMLDYAPDLMVAVADMAKTGDGVLWQDVAPGDTASVPAAPGDSIEVVFDGFLPTGAKVDSGAVALRVGTGSIIPGIDLGVAGMRPGAKRKLVLTPGLAFGAEGAGEIPPHAVLVYDVTLVRIIR